MSVISLTSNNFEKEVINCSQMVLVYFGASWCEQCKMLASILKEIENEQDEIKIAQVDVEKEKDLADKNHIMNMPTMLLYKNAEIVETAMGLKSKDEIIKLIEKNR